MNTTQNESNQWDQQPADPLEFEAFDFPREAIARMLFGLDLDLVCSQQFEHLREHSPTFRAVIESMTAEIADNDLISFEQWTDYDRRQEEWFLAFMKKHCGSLNLSASGETALPAMKQKGSIDMTSAPQKPKRDDCEDEIINVRPQRQSVTTKDQEHCESNETNRPEISRASRTQQAQPRIQQFAHETGDQTAYRQAASNDGARHDASPSRCNDSSSRGPTGGPGR